MATNVTNLPQVFLQLRAIMDPYARQLDCTIDRDDELSLDTQHISPDLKKRMQGKSCFNFASPDEALFNELAALTEAGFQDYRKKGYV